MGICRAAARGRLGGLTKQDLPQGPRSHPQHAAPSSAPFCDVLRPISCLIKASCEAELARGWFISMGPSSAPRVIPPVTLRSDTNRSGTATYLQFLHFKPNNIPFPQTVQVCDIQYLVENLRRESQRAAGNRSSCSAPFPAPAETSHKPHLSTQLPLFLSLLPSNTAAGVKASSRDAKAQI